MKRFLKGFYYAAVGIVSCIKTERNMRVHLCAAFYVLLLMPFYGFTRGEKAAVFICIGAVTAAEAFNTAIEAAVDLSSSELHPLAKLAKDAAAGAVLLMAAASAAVGVTLYFDMEAFGRIGEYFSAHPMMLVLMAISAVGWVFAITRPVGKRKEQDR